MDIQPLTLLQIISYGHEAPNTEDFYRACEQATHLICNVLPKKTIDVIVEGPEEFVKINPLSVLYDFVAALQRTITDGVGISEPNDALGLAQLAVHNFVTRVMPSCTYAFRPRFSRPHSAYLLPARDSWGKLIVKRALLQHQYTDFKEVPPS